MAFVEPTEDRPVVAAAGDPDWWRGAVIYQVYPRSFQDTNNDGIGDLSGIIHRMEYLSKLGVDAIWISPFFKSPMLDFGYDISGFRDVDPMFGSMGDFDALIERAHSLGIKILIDLVLSHTSMEHRWFRESRTSRDNPKADWYVWADPKPDGSPPNNWLSIFGGSAWEWEGERMQYYLHNFLIEQPDLNFHNPDVQDELLNIARFWLDRGVDGFRLDVVNFYFHDAQLRDNPALKPEDRNDNTAPAVNPYNFQDHLYSKTQPENLAFLERLRGVMDEYPAITSVGEIGESQRGMETQNAYTSNGRLHMAYDFDFLSTVYPSGGRIRQVLEKFDRIVTEGWACWAFSNHDVVRHATRFDLNVSQRKLYAAILMTLKGTVCLYQGEELGFTEAYVGYEDLQDPYGKRFWPKFKGRDGCRTPIAWNRDHHGGFSDVRPWLPVALEHVENAASSQERDPGSVLSFYRAFIAFRRTQPALAKGDLKVLEADDDRLIFRREHDGQTVWVAFNLTDSDMTVALPDGNWDLLDDAPFTHQEDDDTVVLPAWQGAFATPRH
ncbi:Oligo-1,6-glucosidase [Rhodobacteraceae bacterium THAF1]|uniref:alpha-glucosidase family protein n=1 Tax=Palleronia sp. THAF1 TaxID=2587842 RepID=UPI000F3AD3D7|nr:alpha-glucosidase family protein [Palleronia sp. THAF1]QFU09181.1 Oligo-1,6-glucosidase [Palleronia sp. THAF1]VDC27270.1 Oligo-1,6-glucosidase [Rhodobacteraceae bacterium THAF1]